MYQIQYTHYVALHFKTALEHNFSMLTCLYKHWHDLITDCFHYTQKPWLCGHSHPGSFHSIMPTHSLIFVLPPRSWLLLICQMIQKSQLFFFLPYVVKQGFSLNVNPINSAFLIGQWGSWLLAFNFYLLLSIELIHIHIWLLYVGYGSKPENSYLQSKYFPIDFFFWLQMS